MLAVPGMPPRDARSGRASGPVRRQVEVALDVHDFVHLVGRAGATVGCVSGTLWITRDGSWHDVVLQPGQVYRVADTARVLVCGLGPSVARVSVPARSTRVWQRLGLAAQAARRRLGPAQFEAPGSRS